MRAVTSDQPLSEDTPRPGVTCDRGSWGHTLGRSNTQSEEKAAGASPAYGGRLRLGLAINDGKRTEREVRNCPLKRGRSRTLACLRRFGLRPTRRRHAQQHMAVGHFY